MTPTNNGGGAAAYFAELSSHTLHVVRIESGVVCFSEASVLDNKRPLDLMLDAALVDWKGSGWTASVTTFLPTTSWHLVETGSARGLDAKTTIESLVKALPYGSELATVWAVCTAETGRPFKSGNEARWLIGVAPTNQLKTLLELGARFKLRAQAIGPGILNYVGAIIGLLPVTRKESVALLEVGGECSNLFLVSAAGVEAVVRCAVKLPDLWEAVREELGMKSQGAAARIFYNTGYDFSLQGAGIAKRIAPAFVEAIAALPSKRVAPSLAIAGLLPTQSWLSTHIANVIGTTSFQVDYQLALRQFGLRADGGMPSGHLDLGTLGLLYLAGATAMKGANWQAVWQPTSDTAKTPANLPNPVRASMPGKPQTPVSIRGGARPPTIPQPVSRLLPSVPEPPTQIETGPPFEAYLGNAPFIFVSYSHRDSGIVYREIDRLHGSGFRIWYDEGIDPGNDWPSAIAGALDRCALVLAFISPRSVESANVRKEITYALTRQKPFVPIHIEETVLPSGLELQIGCMQAILKWRMSSEHYQRKLERCLQTDLRRAPGATTLLDVANFGRHLATNPASDSPAAGSTVEYVQSLKEAEGGALSTDEFVERAKISRQALQDRRATFAIVYWTDAKGQCHYPKWQFDSDMQVLPHVRMILALLHTHDTLRVLTTFLVPSIGEPGTSALKLIHAGRGEEAVAAVRSREDER
jgi:hypothetical protein